MKRIEVVENTILEALSDSEFTIERHYAEKLLKEYAEAKAGQHETIVIPPKIYVVKWHSGDSSHVYDDFTDVIQRLRYYQSREATLIVIDTKEMTMEEIYLSEAV